MNVLSLIGREEPLFTADVARHEAELSRIVSESRFLVIGGAGSIGQAVTREIFKRKPKTCTWWISPRTTWSSWCATCAAPSGYIDGDFSTFAIDCGTFSTTR
jgi:hypothetical protein